MGVQAIPDTTSDLTLRDSAWAMRLFGYDTARRCAFWQFVHTNGVPHVRTGKRKIQFNEQAVRDWQESRSSTAHAR